MALNKADLIAQLRKDPRNADLTVDQLNATVGSVFDAVLDMIQKPGDELIILGFGRFKGVKKASRKGVNPKTGQPTVYPEKHLRMFTFVPKTKSLDKKPEQAS